MEEAVKEACEAWFSQKPPETAPFPGQEKLIHDSIYGTLKVSRLQLFLIDLPCIQRLRRITQTGFASLVYPGANHTRFEHSLGVAHVALMIGRRLREGNGSRQVVTEEDLLLLQVSAIFHDVGHLPFSHVTEEMLLRSRSFVNLPTQEKPSEAIGKAIVESRYFKSVLERVNRELGVGLRAEDVASLVVGEPPRSFPHKRFLAEVIHGTVDADRIDYLTRDAHYTGVPLGTIDMERLVHTATVYETADGELRLGFEVKGKQALESLLVARELMYSSVYHHHTARACGGMLTRGIFYALLAAAGEIGTPLDMIKLDDPMLMECLARAGGKPRRAVERIKCRDVYKTALEISPDDGREGSGERIKALFEGMSFEERVVHEEAIASRAGGVEGVIVDFPPAEKPREVEVSLVSKGGEIVSLRSVSPIVSAIEKAPARLWRGYIFCPGEHVREVRKAAAGYLQELARG